MWIYKGIEFTEDMIPEGAVGFIYGMMTEIDGKKVYYIGKKNFYSDVKKNLGKKELALQTDKRLKKYKRVQKASYQNYYSSNEVLKQAHKEGIPIVRHIFMICFSKQELTYQETKFLFVNEVLEKDVYLNSNILGKFFKKPIV